MLKRDVESEELPYCQQQGIGVVAYSPMASGLLTGRFNFDNLAPDDWRRKSASYAEDNREKALRLLTKLKPVANRYNISFGELAVAWVLKNPAVTSAIVGARKDWQVEETANSANIELSSVDQEVINGILKSF
jgi:aryl-alcohol dehydrogenase-like predicted oxidoreductase